MQIIGFGHRARQGKNTAAMAYFDELPLSVDARLMAFADSLKAEVAKAIRQTGSAHNLVEQFKELGWLPDWVEAEFEGKQRKILQWWGTDYRRAKEPDYWVRRFFEALDELNPEVALVTDVRFPNEAAAIKAAGGILVKVVRIGEPDIRVAEHPSESALDDYRGWDYILQAETPAELKENTRKLYREIASRA